MGFIVVLAALLSGLMTSCVNDASLCGEPVDEGEKVYLRFTLLTRNENTSSGKKKIQSRAADLDGDVVGSVIENTINLPDDIKYYLYDADRKFIADISPKSTTLAETADLRVYQVVSEIDKDFFPDNMDSSVTFYILAFANYQGWGVTLRAPSVGQSIEDFLTANAGMVITTLPNNLKLLRGDYWEAYPGGSYFPMAGLQKFTVLGPMLASSSESTPYDLSRYSGKDLNMQRSLAKIEIIDKINVGEVYDPEVDGAYFNSDPEHDDELRNSWLRIDKVELAGIIDRGSVFPSIDQWYNRDETQQVKAPSVPASAEYYLPGIYNAETGGFDGGDSRSKTSFIPDRYATELRDDKCPVFSGYVFEYSRLTEVAAEQLPYIIVTIRGHSTTEEDGTVRVDAESMGAQVRLADYNNGNIVPDSYIQSLLRNHIYRFEISGIGQDISMKWTLCPMDDLSTDIEFN